MNPDGGDPLGQPDDPRLGPLFALRGRRDEAAAPAYERLLHQPPRPRRGWVAPARWAAVGALLLALAALGIVWWTRPGAAPTPAPPESLALATWKAPTDFLLAVPGGELLDSTPAFPDPRLLIPLSFEPGDSR